MLQNHPITVNAINFFDFYLDKRTRVSINIFDLRGRVVTRLVDDELDAGEHEVIWHAVNDFGEPLAAGVYEYKMETDQFTASKTITIV